MMKLATIIVGILVLAGCASMGYYGLNSSKPQPSPTVAESAKIPLPVPVTPASPRPPPPPPAAAPAPIIRERLMMAPGAGSSSGSSKPGHDLDKIILSRPPSAGPGEPIGGSKPSLKIIEGAKVDDLSVQTFNASMAFSMREKANIDEDIKAQLLIDPSKDLEHLEKELTVKGNKLSKNIKVSKIVKATLTAPDFDVKNITEEEQFIPLDQPTEWLWTLSPKSTGVYEINLSVTAIINIDGRESKHHIKTFERVVTVEITNQQVIKKWIDENWKWAISTLIIPLLVFFFKDKVLKLMKRKK